MKISYRTNPVIEMAEKGKLNKMSFFKIDKEVFDSPLMEMLEYTWGKYSKLFLTDIKIMTIPFLEAMAKASKKLSTVEHILNVPKGNGMFIYRDSTVCYSIDFNNGDLEKESHFVMMIFNNDTLIYLCHIPRDTSVKTVKWVSEQIADTELMDDVVNKDYLYMDNAQINLYLHLNFIKYAPIEVKFLGPNKRLKDVNCQYANDTKSNIQIIDSTWFTTLVQSEGFKVRGHFRLQPCGEGLKDSKLIWINEFEKEGYTRHFKRPVTLEEFTN